MKKEVMDVKGINSANSSYETIVWNTTGDVPILTVTSDLRFPELTGDFLKR